MHAWPATRLSPEQAYRFARGEEVVSCTGIPVKLSRPLDFLVVSDHAEGLGLMFQVLRGQPRVHERPDGRPVVQGAPVGDGGGEGRGPGRGGQGAGPWHASARFKDPKVVGPVMKSVWTEYTATAEKFNEPGRFTAMIGYEWTSVPGGNNLHRNVLFRDGKDKADQVFPFSAWNSEDPEKLWEWMANWEKKTGGQLLDIAHNANLSNGRMFELVDFGGNPLSKEYAEKRARYEVLQEIVQTKGNSETHPLLSPNDEFAGDMGVAGWEYGNLTLTEKPLSKEMMPTNYLRGGLLRGLEQEAKLGTNPFKFGFVGQHRRPQLADRDRGGQLLRQDCRSRSRAPSAGSTSRRRARGTRSSGPCARATRGTTWRRATQRCGRPRTRARRSGTRMKRREVYGTSGSRMAVRFFGGWDFAPGDAKSRFLAEAGYEKGVPMGGDLKAAPAGAKAPKLPRRGDEGRARRQPRPHPDREGLARQGRQGPGEGLRRGVGRRRPAEDRGAAS